MTVPQRLTAPAVCFLISVVLLFSGNMASNAASAASSPNRATVATVACPEAAVGGPFWRLCTKPLFQSASLQAYDGVAGVIKLPCSATTAPDFRKRFGMFGKGKTTTTDEGYAYFSYNDAYSAFEVGLEHNSQAGNYTSYKLYATGIPGNPGFHQYPGQISCNRRLLISFQLTHAFDQGVELKWGVLYVEVDDSRSGEVLGYFNYVIPIIRPWIGCSCRLSVVTAIAQGGPHGPVPRPLPDGASYGPVGWSGLEYYTSSTAGWITAADIQYSKAFTGGVATIQPPSGTLPDITVGPITLPCKARSQSTSPSDYWSCRNLIRGALRGR